MSATDIAENYFLDSALGDNHTANWPDTVYIGLLSSVPVGDYGSGVEVRTPGAEGYARVALANTDVNWPPAVAGEKPVAVNIEFPVATGSWGAAEGWGMWSEATGGDLLLHGNFTTKTITEGTQPFFLAGNLVITCD